MSDSTRFPRSVNRYLAQNERILHLCRRHPIVLVKPAAAWLMSVLATGLLGGWLSRVTEVDYFENLAVVVVIGLTFVFGFKVLNWVRDRYLITDQRVLLLSGVVAIKVSSVSLARVGESSFERSIPGRVFGYGVLRLDSAGEQLGLSKLDFLPRPDEIYRMVSSLLLSNSTHRGFGGPSDPSEADTGELPPVVG